MKKSPPTCVERFWLIGFRRVRFSRVLFNDPDELHEAATCISTFYFGSVITPHVLNVRVGRCAWAKVLSLSSATAVLL